MRKVGLLSTIFMALGCGVMWQAAAEDETPVENYPAQLDAYSEEDRFDLADKIFGAPPQQPKRRIPPQPLPAELETPERQPEAPQASGATAGESPITPRIPAKRSQTTPAAPLARQENPQQPNPQQARYDSPLRPPTRRDANVRGVTYETPRATPPARNLPAQPTGRKSNSAPQRLDPATQRSAQPVREETRAARSSFNLHRRPGDWDFDLEARRHMAPPPPKGLIKPRHIEIQPDYSRQSEPRTAASAKPVDATDAILAPARPTGTRPHPGAYSASLSDYDEPAYDPVPREYPSRQVGWTEGVSPQGASPSNSPRERTLPPTRGNRGGKAEPRNKQSASRLTQIRQAQYQAAKGRASRAAMSGTMYPNYRQAGYFDDNTPYVEGIPGAPLPPPVVDEERRQDADTQRRKTDNEPSVYEPFAPCDSCNYTPCCPRSFHHVKVFAELLYLRPGNMDVAYAIEQTDFNAATALPVGPQGIAGLDSQPGYRLGFSMPVSQAGSLSATYTSFQSSTESRISAGTGNFISSLVSHPSIESSGPNSLSAAASLDVDFQFVDLDYHAFLMGNCCWNLNYSAGFRYARLSQDFQATQNIAAASGLAIVNSDIDFDGYGVRFGLDGRRINRCNGLFYYGKTAVSFLGGEYGADYQQTNQLSADLGTAYEDYRLSTILEAEIGLGWESQDQRYSATIGYSVMAWHNALLMDEFLQGVQASSYTDTSDFITFDGVNARFTWTW